MLATLLIQLPLTQRKEIEVLWAQATTTATVVQQDFLNCGNVQKTKASTQTVDGVLLQPRSGSNH